MKLNIADFHRALTFMEDAGCTEAAISAQFALDLAATARFGSIEPAVARKLLQARIARHRATLQTASTAIH